MELEVNDVHTLLDRVGHNLGIASGPTQLTHRHKVKPAEVNPASPPGPVPQRPQPVPG
jgi:hypothetical protein